MLENASGRLGGGPLERNVYWLYIHYCGYYKSQYIITTTSFQEGPHQKMFFHLQESEDERRARVDEKI